MRIAILGSSGNIARGLIENLPREHRLSLYSRTQDRALALFPFGEHDVVINCIGIREKLWTEPHEIFALFEQYDGIVLDYLRRHPDTLCISFSSGAVYGGIYDEPADEDSRAVIDINGAAKETFYGIAKLNSEAKHRSLPDRNIIDLRVFSYFSRHQRPDDLCLMAEVLSCLRDGRTLETSPQDFLRDYIHPLDLCSLVERCIDYRWTNAAFDAYSLRPVGKFELLAAFAERYGLQWRVSDDWRETSPTGPKRNYYSRNLAAAQIGYVPQYTSLDSLLAEMDHVLRSGSRASLKVTA